jgi:hypothetical protein
MNNKPFVVILAGLIGLGLVLLSACGNGTSNTNTDTQTVSEKFKAPDGTFPPEIAGYNASGHPLTTLATDKLPTFFGEFYWKSGKKITYTRYVLPSAAEAKEFFTNILDSDLDTYSAAYTDDRRVHYHTKDNGVDTQLLLGQSVVTLVAADVNDSLEFEAGLPYAVYGVPVPPKHTLGEVKDQPRQGLELLAEFKKDPKAFKATYDTKSLLVAGKVTVTSKAADGAPTIAMQAPGGGDSDALNFLTITFGKNDKLAAALKVGEIVLCRGKVDADTDLEMLFINDCVMP